MLHPRLARILTVGLGLSLGAAHTARAQSYQVTTYPLHFETGKSTLDTGDQETVRAVASVMKNNPNLVATIIGKADTQGSAELNEKLSQRRSEAVFEALAHENNVPESRVEIRWTGEKLPFVSTADEEAERMNRLVEIVVR